MGKNLFLIILFLAILAGGWYYFQSATRMSPITSAPLATTSEPIATANPASANCGEKGGQLVLESNPAGGQFGVCYFSDNHQCEEWALYRGDCPEGGVPVMSYKTPEARYCAIAGGLFKDDICTLADEKKCDASEFFAGRCPAGGTNGH